MILHWKQNQTFLKHVKIIWHLIFNVCKQNFIGLQLSSFVYILTQWKSCNREHMACKSWNICYLTLNRKVWQSWAYKESWSSSCLLLHTPFLPFFPFWLTWIFLFSNLPTYFYQTHSSSNYSILSYYFFFLAFLTIHNCLIY